MVGLPATRILECTLHWITDGSPMPAGFNDTLKVFIPKNTDSPFYSPEAVRPLGLKNTDNKTISAVTNNALKPAISDYISSVQAGFVAGRNFVENMVLADTFARCYGMLPASFLPLIALFDFAAAFPPVAHDWIHLVIEAAGLPQGIVNLFREIYRDVFAYGRSSSEKAHYLFQLASGIIQGCPLAGTLFAILIDPFLRAINKTFIDNIISPSPCHHPLPSGAVHACADDIAVVLSSITGLIPIQPIFD